MLRFKPILQLIAVLEVSTALALFVEFFCVYILGGEAILNSLQHFSQLHHLLAHRLLLPLLSSFADQLLQLGLGQSDFALKLHSHVRQVEAFEVASSDFVQSLLVKHSAHFLVVLLKLRRIHDFLALYRDVVLVNIEDLAVFLDKTTHFFLQHLRVADQIQFEPLQV